MKAAAQETSQPGGLSCSSGMFNIGIEIESLLVSLEASEHDAKEHPKMHDDMRGEYDGLDLNVTIETEGEDMPPCMHYHPAASTYLSNFYVTNAV